MSQEKIQERSKYQLFYKKTTNIKLLHEYVERFAVQQPNKNAIVYRDESITYQLLDARANQFSPYIKDILKGSVLNRIILYLDRNIDYFIGVLSLLKLGITYIPIDRKTPFYLVNQIIHDSQAEVIITDLKKRSMSLDHRIFSIRPDVIPTVTLL